MLADDLSAADHWVDDWQSSIEQRAAQARALSQRVAGLTATARDDAALVEVTVDSSGGLSQLWLDDRIRRLSGSQVAERIVAVMRSAQAQLTQRVSDATSELMGADSATGQAIIDSYRRRFVPPTESDRDTGR